MRISSYSVYFTLYEVLIIITPLGIISGLIKESMLQLLNRLEFFNTADQFKDTLRHAKFLSTKKSKSNRINNVSGFLIIQEKSTGIFQIVSKLKIPKVILESANSGTSFNSFRFAYGSTIINKNEDYSTKVDASQIGRFHQTAVNRK